MKKEVKDKGIEVQPKLIPTHVQPIRFQLNGVKIVKADNNLKRIYKIRN